MLGLTDTQLGLLWCGIIALLYFYMRQSQGSGGGGGGGGGAGQTIGSSGGGATAGSAAPAAATGQPMSADEVGKHAIWPAALPVFAVRTLRRPHVPLRRALTA